MTETATGLNIGIDALQKLYDEVNTVDEQIAAASGSEAMGKRAYLNSLAEEHKGVFSELIEGVIDSLKDAHDPAILAGAVTALDKALTDSFGKQVDEFAAKYVEENKKDQPEVSQEELDKLDTEAREGRKKYWAMRGLLEQFGFDVSSVPEPKKMTGSRGPRGPRTLSSFDYFIKQDDGTFKKRADSMNSLGSIANTDLKDSPFSKAQKLREELARQGLNIQDPADTWEYTLTWNDGKDELTIKGVKTQEKDEYVKSDDSDEDGPEVDESVTHE